MNALVKARWVEVLRSGEYKQGEGMLRNARGEFCCLGVLCDLHSKETGTKWEHTDIAGYTYLGEAGYLPQPVMEWAELGERNPFVGTAGKVSLSAMNDRGDSFATIASEIEARL